MKTGIRASGITIETRGDLASQAPLKLRRRHTGDWPLAARPSGRRRGGAAPDSAPLSEEEAIIGAFEDQQLDLVDAIPLVPTPPAPQASGGRRRRTDKESPAATSEVDITVPLGPEESAVVLVERDGVYEWNLMGAEGPAPLVRATATPSRRRRGSTASSTTTQSETQHARSLRFTVAVQHIAAVTPKRRATRRGLLKKLGLGKVIAYVFRFVARPVLGSAVRLLERNVSEGLVHVTQPDPLSWATLADDAPLTLPTGRPARVLLLVHGTFSSTVGSFGALAANDTGRALLQAMLAHYDLVLGWDHRTLSALPTDNAVDIATRLERIGFAEPPEVDAIAFSRGGLVLRSLIEHVLPTSPKLLRIRRAVFVACTNGGTELARPANWHHFVDRYMNLAAAGARGLALVPGFNAAGTVLSSAVRGLGVFVKVMATSAINDGAVPGIAAMDPDGAFVREINGAQPGQPLPQETFYCAVTSNYDLDAAAREVDPDTMSPSLLLKLADKATDALYRQPNDLVVHVESMTQIDVGLGAYVRERLEFGSNGRVHHCNYFAQPKTAAALAGWLGVGSPVNTAVRRSASRGKFIGTAGAGRPIAPPPSVVTLRSSLPVALAMERLRASRAPWVVVERPYAEGSRPAILHYAYPSELGLSWLKDWRTRSRQATVFEAFNLRETGRSMEAPAGTTEPPAALPYPPSREALESTFGSQFRTVLIDRGQSVGVISPAESVSLASDGDSMVLAHDTLADGQAPVAASARRRSRASEPAASPPSTVARRGAGTTAAAKKAAAAPGATQRPAASADQVACYFRAESDDEFVLQQAQPVAVTISREALAPTVARTSAGGAAKVKAHKPLVVECMPMLRLALNDPDDARVEIPVPPAGEPVTLRFDLVGQEVGPAEVRVQVRQGPLPLVMLTLTPSVVAARTGTRRPVAASAELANLPDLPRATDELRIVQMRPTGQQTQYRFDLRLPSQKVQASFESAPLDTDPPTYVAQLHKRIEDRWAEHRSEKDAFARDLRAIGADLFDELFPLELRQLMWQHRENIKSVQVLSSEPFIPWELVHVRDPAARKAGPGSAFLGEMGVVRWLINGYAPEKLRLRKGKTRYLVPDYPSPNTLPGAQQEIALVEQRFGAKAVVPEAEAVYGLIESPGQFDLLHVACHGVADPADIAAACLEMPGKRRSDGSMSDESVLASTVRREAELADGDWKPIVVLNACQSLRGGYSLKGVGGFAEAFVEGGAGVIVGSGWSVGDEPALTFIEAFYDRFCDPKKPATLAQAAAAARQKAREDGDATWLAYVVYGHPRAKVAVS